MHGCNGMWGVIAMAIFHNEKGIIYGAVSSYQTVIKDNVSTQIWVPRGWDLLWV